MSTPMTPKAQFFTGCFCSLVSLAIALVFLMNWINQSDSWKEYECVSDCTNGKIYAIDIKLNVRTNLTLCPIIAPKCPYFSSKLSKSTCFVSNEPYIDDKGQLCYPNKETNNRSDLNMIMMVIFTCLGLGACFVCCHAGITANEAANAPQPLATHKPIEMTENIYPPKYDAATKTPNLIELVW